MNRILSGLRLATLGLLIAVLPSQVQAQSMDLQPGVVISLTNVEEHISDIEHLMEAAGVGQLAGLVRMTTGEYLRGIDVDKPIGALLFFDEDNPEEPDVMSFLPVTDFEDVLDTLAPFVDIDEDGDDFILTAADGTEITTRVTDGYAFMVMDKEMLETLPENPAEMLEDLPKEYNVAARVFGQNIPEGLRQQAIDLIKAGAESEMRNLGDGPEADLQRANFEYTMSEMEGIINETEEFVAGLAIDEDGGRIYLDFKMVGVEGSKLARQSNEFAKAPATRFGGFLVEDAAANFHVNGKLLEEDIEKVQKVIGDIENAARAQIEEEDLEGEEAKAAQQLVDDLAQVVRDSVAKGHMDGGGSLVIENGDLQLVMGMSIAEGAKLETSVKKLAEWAKADDVPAKFNFDMATENGIRYHQIVLEVPSDEVEAREMFGEELEVLLGVGDDVVYLAAGKDCKALLTKCMNGTAPTMEEGMMTQMNMSVWPILRFMATVTDEADLTDIAELLPEDASGRIRMTMRAVPNGQQFRFEMEDAMLKVLTEIGQSMGGGGFAPDDF